MNQDRVDAYVINDGHNPYVVIDTNESLVTVDESQVDNLILQLQDLSSQIKASIQKPQSTISIYNPRL